MRVSMNEQFGGKGGDNQKTTWKCHEIKRNLNLTSKNSLERDNGFLTPIHKHLT